MPYRLGHALSLSRYRIDVIINLSGQTRARSTRNRTDISPSSTYPLDHDANQVISEHSEALSARMLVGRSAKKGRPRHRRIPGHHRSSTGDDTERRNLARPQNGGCRASLAAPAGTAGSPLQSPFGGTKVGLSLMPHAARK